MFVEERTRRIEREESRETLFHIPLGEPLLYPIYSSEGSEYLILQSQNNVLLYQVSMLSCTCVRCL